MCFRESRAEQNDTLEDTHYNENWQDYYHKPIIVVCVFWAAVHGSDEGPCHTAAQAGLFSQRPRWTDRWTAIEDGRWYDDCRNDYCNRPRLLVDRDETEKGSFGM